MMEFVAYKVGQAKRLDWIDAAGHAKRPAAREQGTSWMLASIVFSILTCVVAVLSSPSLPR